MSTEVTELQQNLDAFDRLTVRGELNDGDLASMYQAAPERWRLYSDGVREFIQYAADPENPAGIPYQHDKDVHRLSPPAGETLTFRTAVFFRYVVNYVKALSWAMETTRDFEPGEYVVAGAMRGTPGKLDPEASDSDVDGWPIRWGHDIDPTGQQAKAYDVRAGTVKDTRDIEFANGAQDWTRYLTEANWYNVGNAITTETYTLANGQQKNVKRSRTAVSGERGPTTGNMRVQVEANATASGLDIEFGSVGVATLSDATPIVKAKGAEFDGLSHSGSGQWESMLAFKTADAREDHFLELVELAPLATPGTTDEVLIISVDPSKTDANFLDPDDDGTEEGEAAPNEHNPANSALRYTFSVSTFPDVDGNVVTSTGNPGGWQIGHASARSESSGKSFTTTQATRKRPMNADGDYAIVLGKTSTSGNFDLEVDTEEDS